MISPQPLDIWLVRIQFRDCKDLRPTVAIQILAKQNRAVVLPVSSALDLRRTTVDFLIEKTHVNFPATGLTRTSFVVSDRFRDLPFEAMEKRIGRLEGELAASFIDWLG